MGHYQLLERGRGDVLVQARVFGIRANKAKVFQRCEYEAPGVDGLSRVENVKAFGRQFSFSQHDILNGTSACPVLAPHATPASVGSNAQVQGAVFGVTANNKAQR